MVSDFSFDTYSQFSPLFYPGTPKHSQLQEFLGTLRCFGFVVNVDWAVISWAGEGRGVREREGEGGRGRGKGEGGRGKGEGNVAGPLPSPVCRMKTTHGQVAGEKHEILKLKSFDKTSCYLHKGV